MARVERSDRIAEALRRLEASQKQLDEVMTDLLTMIRLACVECGARASGPARGWRTYLDVDDEPVTFCPDCAEEEFDG